MTAGEFSPLLRSAELLGLGGLVIILVVCWVVFPAVIHVANRTNGPSNEGTSKPVPSERWLIHPLQFLVMWYLGATIVDQVRHGSYDFGSLWPSSFAASALFASSLLILGFREPRAPRWFLLMAFLFGAAVFGVAIQFASWFFPRYITFLLGAF